MPFAHQPPPARPGWNYQNYFLTQLNKQKQAKQAQTS
jgi:hypothetical protein